MKRKKAPANRGGAKMKGQTMGLITIGRDSKLGIAVATVSFQAGESCNPLASQYCKGKCYACKGNCGFHQHGKYAQNLALWREDSAKFEDILTAEIALFRANGGQYFRYFVSGDIPDTGFLSLMARIALQFRDLQFMAYSKQDTIINAWLAHNRKPCNLSLILSHWYNDFTPDNPHRLPTSQIVARKKPAPGDGYLCPDKCPACGYRCWRLRPGQRVYFPEH